jgi:hypothetical protein
METNKNEIYVVSVEDTIKYGIVSAAIIGRVRWWCKYNEDNKVKDRFHIDYWWSGFMSSREFADQLGISQKTIEKHLSKLLKNGVLIKGCFNKKGFDRTGWYRVNPHPPIEETISPNRVNDIPKKSKSISPNVVNGNTPTEETIPVNPSVKQNVRETVSTTVKPPVNPSVEDLLKQLEHINLLIEQNIFEVPDDRGKAYCERTRIEREIKQLSTSKK